MKRLVVFAVSCAMACIAVVAIVSGGAIAAYSASVRSFVLVLVLSWGFAMTCFAFGAATGDYSWVDRLWSIVPVLFAWLYAARGGFGARSVASAVLVTLWGARLTRNFARRGGYSGTEDYRWSVLRGRMGSPALWQAFNAFFICAAQLGIIALFSSPLALVAEGAARFSSASLGAILAASVLPLFFLAYEAEADREQWEFQVRKLAYFAGAEASDEPKGRDTEAEMGFRSSGLFRLSRHPAYFGELGFWWSVYLSCSVGSGRLLHWSVAGAIALTALFVGSTRFTESLSAAKYPAYEEYRRATPAIVPRIPKKG